MIIPRDLKLRHIAGFLAVAEMESVTAAARQLSVSQPALSKTIADIERSLGNPLFDRVGRRMLLTAAGKMFRRHALTAISSLEAGVQAVSGQSGQDAISVGVLPTVTGGLFPFVTLDFVQDRPGVSISVTTGPHGYLLDRLRAGAIDLMVGRMPAPDEMAGLRFEFLYDDPIELVARADHPQRTASVEHALAESPVILPTRESIIRRIVDEFLNARGLTHLHPTLETVSLNLALPLLMNSDMLWFISRGVVARELDAGSLIRFNLGADYMSGAVGITLQHTRNENRHADYLIELLHLSAGTLHSAD
ncbi:LysR substrate-binding domain-containing protein [Loktanella agnita]|uniref:LysR substrate-binding domain-containing protein n=1 Tax=Loktanella agnita TaxID=287097 RepID=UPI0039865DB1